MFPLAWRPLCSAADWENLRVRPYTREAYILTNVIVPVFCHLAGQTTIKLEEPVLYGIVSCVVYIRALRQR